MAPIRRNSNSAPTMQGATKPKAQEVTIRSTLKAISMEKQFNVLRRSIIAQIQNLTAKERFDRLCQLAVSNSAEASITLSNTIVPKRDKLIDSFSPTTPEIKALLDGTTKPPFDVPTISQKAQRWAGEMNLFLWEIQEMANLSFDTHVKEHVVAQVAHLEGLPKLIALTKDENFPLFLKIKYKYDLRVAVMQSFSKGTPFADRVRENAEYYDAYIYRMHEVLALTSRFIRMQHFDANSINELVNDIKNQITSSLGPLVAIDGIYLVTPIMARITALEDPNIPCLPEMADMTLTITRKQWLVAHLEQFGKKKSLALKEERQYLKELMAVKRRYEESIATLLEEFRGMVGLAMADERPGVEAGSGEPPAEVGGASIAEMANGIGVAAESGEVGGEAATEEGMIGVGGGLDKVGVDAGGSEDGEAAKVADAAEMANGIHVPAGSGEAGEKAVVEEGMVSGEAASGEARDHVDEGFQGEDTNMADVPAKSREAEEVTLLEEGQVASPPATADAPTEVADNPKPTDEIGAPEKSIKVVISVKRASQTDKGRKSGGATLANVQPRTRSGGSAAKRKPCTMDAEYIEEAEEEDADGAVVPPKRTSGGGAARGKKRRMAKV